MYKEFVMYSMTNNSCDSNSNSNNNNNNSLISI